MEATRKEMALELVADIRHLDAAIAAIKKSTAAAVEASGTSVTDVFDVGPIVAALLIGHTGDITRFPTAGHYASYNATAPIEASSGKVVRHRLNLRGNRQLNQALHMAAVTQLGFDAPGHTPGRRSVLLCRVTPVVASMTMEREAGTAVSARWTAAARARESARPDHLFDDPWAAELAGAEGFAMLQAREPDGVPNPYLPIRTRFFDDVVLRQRDSVAQVVLLGAGYDTRAVRLPLPATTTVYALDQPEVLRRTEAVLTRVRAAREDAPVWVPVSVDLAHDWKGALLRAGFDPLSPVLWVAEGLLFYLTAAHVHATLSTAAHLSSPRSTLVADVFGTGLLDLPGMRGLVEHRHATGAPLPYCTDDPRALLNSTGWAVGNVVEPGQAEANFGRLPAVPEGSHGGADPSLRAYFILGRTV